MDRVATLTLRVKTCVDCPYIKKWMKNSSPVPTLGATCKQTGKDISDWNTVPAWCVLPEIIDVEAKDVAKVIEHKKEAKK